jgi:TolB protein
MNADGSDQIRVTDYPDFDAWPSWSPNGKRLVYCSWDSDSWSFDIFVINIDGSGRTNLTNHPALELDPHWGFFGTCED